MISKFYYSLIPAFSLALLASGFHGACAEAEGEPAVISTSADEVALSSETVQLPLFSGAQLSSEPGVALSSAAKAAASKLQEPKADTCAALVAGGGTWLDHTHDYMDRKLCQPAAWFDNFFGNDSILDNARPTMFVSLRNSLRWTEGQGATFVKDYKFRYRLPQMEKIFKKAGFYVTSGSSVDKYTFQPGQPVDPGADPVTGESKPTMGLHADLLPRSRSQFTVDTGIKFHIPVDPFIRVRYQYTDPFAEDYVLRFTEIPLWRLVEHFTETSQLDLERQISASSILRWSDYLTYTQHITGMTWNTGFTLLSQLTPKSAISYETSVWGMTSDLWTIENYRVGIRYRRNFYRSWLFYELSPEVTWPKGASGRRNSTIALMATLEIQFGK